MKPHSVDIMYSLVFQSCNNDDYNDIVSRDRVSGALAFSVGVVLSRSLQLRDGLVAVLPV